MPTKKNNFSTEQLALLGIDYANTKDSIKKLEVHCKEARTPLEDYLRAFGRTTENGSRIAVLSHADIDVHLKHTLRSGKQLLPEAIDILEELGLEDCIENVPIIREDIIERYYEEGKISDEVMLRLYADKSSFAFSVELKNRMTDAPE